MSSRPRPFHRLRTAFAAFAGLLALASSSLADSDHPLVGTWHLTGFEGEVNPPDAHTGKGSGKVLVNALPIKTVDVSEPSPGTLRFVFRDAKGEILDTEDNTFERDGDFFERVTDESEPNGRERERFGIQLVRDGLALVHNLGGWLSLDELTLWDAWTAAAVLTREPLPKANASFWTGPYSGEEWIYSTAWDEDDGHRFFRREHGELSFNVDKAGSGYRIRVQYHGSEEEDDVIPAKASGSFLAVDFQEKGGTLWDDEWNRITLALDREFYRAVQVSPREVVVLGVSGAAARVTPKQGNSSIRTPYHQTDYADANIVYLVSTAHFFFEGQAVSLAGPDDPSGLFTAKGLSRKSGMEIDQETGALTGFANLKSGSYAITRTAYSLTGFVNFSDTVYLRVLPFPASLLANPDSPGKLVYNEFDALLRAPLGGAPVGKVELKLAASGLFTGKFRAGDTTLIRALKGRFAPDPEGATASATIPLSSLDATLVLTLTSDGGLDATLNSHGTTLAVAEPGDFSGRVRLPSAANPAPGAQAKGNVAYTLALSPDGDPGDAPGGHGWATATINPSGKLSLKGKLADGRPLTGSLRPTTAGYLAYLKPYGKVVDAYLAGRLALSPRDGGGHHVANAADGAFVWSKPAAVNGVDRVPVFGPTALVARLEPWTEILTDEEFAAALGVEDDTLAVTLDGGITFAPARPLPELLTFAVRRGKFSSAVAAPILHDTATANTKAWAKAWKLSVNLSNGTFTGHFILSDTVLAPTKKNPNATKIVTRKVPVSGVLLNGVASPFALGHYVVPALAKTDPALGGAITLGAPAE